MWAGPLSQFRRAATVPMCLELCQAHGVIVIAGVQTRQLQQLDPWIRNSLGEAAAFQHVTL